MRSDLFDFEIPPERIAQEPATRREQSRLLVVHRSTQRIEHRRFFELPEILQPRDLLVLNDTRVEPCRLHCKREGTGGHVELFLLRSLGGGEYEALTGSWKNLKPGSRVELPSQGGLATLAARDPGPGGHWRVRFEMPAEEAERFIREHARMPLPPYIRRERGKDAHDAMDAGRYQTVFAHHPGAVAAPTAGLHFTPELLEKLGTGGVRNTRVTLHVGPGTFRPLKADRLPDHPMHAERYAVSPRAEADIAETRRAGGRVIAVGTTACRTLETTADERGSVRPGSGSTALFIYPPWRFRAVDGLLTNFHLPRSTLIFLVAAWLGVGLTRRAYEEALDGGYRFFSYGDAMLALP